MLHFSLGNAVNTNNFKNIESFDSLTIYNLKLKKIWDNLYNKGLKLTEKEKNTLKIIEKKSFYLDNRELFYNIAIVHMNIPDSVNAEKWMTKACESYHPYAYHNMGWWYDFGFGHIGEDKDMAADLYDFAYWNLGVARSAVRLSEMIFYKEITKYDEDYAIDTLTHIISLPRKHLIEENDITVANYMLGRFYFNRHSGKEETSALNLSIKYFREAAKKGHKEANLFAGKALRTKYRVNKDKILNDEAKLYYSHASSLGSGDAMVYLGITYLENYQTEEEFLIGLGWILAGHKAGIYDSVLKKQVSANLKSVDQNIISLIDPLAKNCKDQQYKNCFKREK